MDLSDQSIHEFIEAWRADFGESLSPETACSEANRLLDFFIWMNEELRQQQSVIRLPPPRSGGCGDVGDVGDVAKEAWRRTMRRDAGRPPREFL